MLFFEDPRPPSNRIHENESVQIMLTFEATTKREISFLDKVCHVTYEWKGEFKENVHTVGNGYKKSA